MKHALNRGFTITEILVVIAIMAIFMTVSYKAFKNLGDASALRIATQDVYTTLIDARNSTLAAESNSVFGVHISETEVTKFIGTTYNPVSPTNVTLPFQGGVTASSTFIANNSEIVFEHLTGIPTATGTILLRKADGTGTTTITVTGTGLIEED